MYELFNTISNGFLFGFIDNGIVVGGILSVAWLAGRKLDPEARAKAMSIAVGCAFVGSLSNALSDFIGALGDPTMWNSVTGITTGCLSWSAILIIPKSGLIVTRKQ
jgi:hypothetical protein